MIWLETLTIEGFRAFSKPTEFRPSTVAGLKHITGSNKTNRRLGANGAGKSSLWDALVWCLYGTSVRGLRSSDLVSWGGKAISVTALLDVNGQPVRITRTSKPPRIIMHDNAVEQADVDKTIGLTKARFLHSVLFGQAVRLLPDLSLPERAQLFDDIMNLNVWNAATAEALNRYALESAGLADAEQGIAALEAKLGAYTDEFLASLEDDAAAWEERKDETLAAVRAAKAREKKRLVRALEALDALPHGEDTRGQLKAISTDMAALSTKRDAVLRDLSDLRARITSAKKNIAFYEDNETCPTCYQPIDRAFVKNEVRKSRIVLLAAEDASAAGATIRDELEVKVDKLRTKRDTLLKSVGRTEEAIRSASAVVSDCEARLRRAERDLEEMEAAADDNPHQRRLDEINKIRAAAKHEMVHFAEAVAASKKNLATLDYWRTGFKKVRLFVLKRTLSLLEVDVGNAMGQLGLNGWKVQFATETENKSGGSKLGIQIVVSSPTASATWDAWSGGEGQRLRVAIAVGFANLIHRLAGTNFGFEVWDEPSSWLSPEGVEDLLAMLAHRAQQTGKSIWLLDHRALQHTSFAEIWEVKKNRNGSSVSKIQ